MDKINLIIPKKSEYMSTIRLTTSALSNLKGFNADEIEDIKVIISEVCTFFISNVKNCSEPFNIKYEISENIISVEVADLNSGEILDNNTINSEMCIMIIESLADNYNFDLPNKRIVFEKSINIFG